MKSKIFGCILMVFLATQYIEAISKTTNQHIAACKDKHLLFCKRNNDSKSQRRKGMRYENKSYGPSDGTMRQTVISGGYMSGGHMSISMGAGATRGHGHR